MARSVRLKVYRASAGFEDAYVAAPSQAAALQAWGARGDLFAIGEAEVVTDAELAAEPLARPGEVVRRPRGDMAAMLAATPKVAKPPQPKPAGTPPAGSARPVAPPDRSALGAAETAAVAARERLGRELRAIAEARAELDGREERTRREGRAEAKRLETARAVAERAYVAAGGKPANHSA